MKIKNFYIYGIIIIASAFVTIYFVQKKPGNIQPVTKTSEQVDLNKMPKDSIHQKMMAEANQTPGKNNVSPDYQRMLSEKKTAYEKNSNDTAAIRAYADFLMESHKLDEAIALYDKILKANPKRTDIYFALTFAYFNKKDFEKAEELTQKVLSYDSKNLQAQYNIGAIEAAKGNKGKAREIWQKLITNHPNSPTSRLAEQQILKLDIK